jgi:hypothetical protein
VLGVCLILIITSKYGPAISPDSACYLSIAENLTKGNGFVIYDLEPAVAWPPLYPIILTFSKLLGLEINTWARIFNSLLFGVFLFIASNWIQKNLENPTLVWIGFLGTLFSPALIYIGKYAWSELTFASLVLFVLIHLEKLTGRTSLKSILFLALLAALACLTRYIGVSLVIFCSFWIFLHGNVDFRKKLIYSLIFILASLAPLSLWLIRNYSVSSTLAGPRVESSSLLFDNILHTADALSSWIMPEPLSGYVRAPIAVVIILSVLYFWLKTHKKSGASSQFDSKISLMVCFCTFYVISLILIGSNTAIGHIDWRFLSPIYIPLLLVILMQIDLIIKGAPKENRILKKTVIVLLTAWALSLSLRTAADISESLQNGAGDYSTDLWQNSELIHYLSLTPQTGKLYSNFPDGIYAIAGLAATISPRKTYYASPSSPPYDINDFESQIGKSNKVMLAWFNTATRPSLFTPEELLKNFDLTLVKKFKDGRIYRVSLKQSGA